MQRLLGNLLLALLKLTLGVGLGVLLFEITVRANPNLLLRGMDLPSPADMPLATYSYSVYYSDADVFVWRPDLIRPIHPAENRLEAQVDFQTDEFGFRNQPPLAEQVDVIILGRSTSLGAQVSTPWPAHLARQTGWTVLNLSQPSEGIYLKNEYIRQFGLPRRPRWVIVEVIPSLDFFDVDPPPVLLTQRLALPFLRTVWQEGLRPSPVSVSDAIYPLRVELPGRTVNLTCCIHYLDFFTIDDQALRQSRDWATYQDLLLNLVAELRSHSICVALLYAPTKPDVYFPLAVVPEQLKPTLREVIPKQLAPDGKMVGASGTLATVESIQANAFAGRDLIRAFALEQDLTFIDPSPLMINSILAGDEPFMAYDSHWSAFGHDLIGQAAAEVLNTATCP